MMHTMLIGTNLDSSYWSHALRHAVYIKNSLPYSALPGHITPFQRFTGRRPDLTHLRVLGSHVTVKQPQVRQSKLDATFTTTGIFLGHTATHRAIWFEDTPTVKLKSARHAIFDEDHYTPNNRPPYAQELMNLAEKNQTNPFPLTPSSSLPIYLIPDLNTPFSPPTGKKSSIIDIVPPLTPPHQPRRIPTTNNITTHSTNPRSNRPMLHVIPDEDTTQLPAVLATSSPKPEEFTLLFNPFGHLVYISLPTKGTYPTLDLSLE